MWTVRFLWCSASLHAEAVKVTHPQWHANGTQDLIRPSLAVRLPKECGPDLGLLSGAGEGNRTLTVSLGRPGRSSGLVGDQPPKGR
jgi:hypothetical protein